MYAKLYGLIMNVYVISYLIPDTTSNVTKMNMTKRNIISNVNAYVSIYLKNNKLTQCNAKEISIIVIIMEKMTFYLKT